MRRYESHNFDSYHKINGFFALVLQHILVVIFIFDFVVNWIFHFKMLKLRNFKNGPRMSKSLKLGASRLVSKAYGAGPRRDIVGA